MLNPPLPDMVCVLLGLGPFQRGPEGSSERSMVSLEVNRSLPREWTHKRPIASKVESSELRRLLVALGDVD